MKKNVISKIYFKPTVFAAFIFALSVTFEFGITLKAENQEDLVKDNLPTTSFFITRSGYSIAYDSRTRNPLYAYEKLSSSSLAGRVSRDNCQFKEDTRIPEIFRSTLKDYQRSGYDRGHLAPAANHKGSYEEMAETFFMSNMCPQCPQFNRGYWSRFEKYVRDLTAEYQTVEVFTGPLYLPKEESDGKRYVKYQVIGENDVAVPTHFFKLLNLLDINGNRETVAYILPNEEIPAKTPLDSFKTTIQKVEKAAGIIFPKG